MKKILKIIRLIFLFAFVSDANAITYFDSNTNFHPSAIPAPTGLDWIDSVGFIETINPFNTSVSSTCTGTAISAGVVLTAGHCFDFNKDGSIDNNQTKVSFHYGNSSYALTGSVIINPNYAKSTSVGNTMQNDIAVIKLDQPILNVTPTVTYYAGALDNRALNLFESSPSDLVGYGKYYDQGSPISNNSFGNRRTGSNYVEGYQDLNGGSFVATLRNNQNITASGDSGGPLVFKVNGAPVVIGVSSFGTDVNLNGSFADIGDKAYWTYTGNYSSFISNIISTTFQQPTQIVSIVTPVQPSESSGSGDIIGGYTTAPIQGSKFIFNKFSNCDQIANQGKILCKIDDSEVDTEIQPAAENNIITGYADIPLALAPVPEPETYALMFAGLALVGAVASRRKAATAA